MWHSSRLAGYLLKMFSDVHKSRKDTADSCQHFFPYVAIVMTTASAYSNSTFDLAVLLLIIMTIHFTGGHMGENSTTQNVRYYSDDTIHHMHQPSNLCN